MCRLRWSSLYWVVLLLLLAACDALDPGTTPTSVGLTPTPTLLPATRAPLPSHTAEPSLPQGPFPPRLVEAWPRAGEEVPTDAVLTWLFDQPMDRQSVEATIRLFPETPGTFSWESDRDVSFAPESLLPGHRYLVSLSGEVRSAAGLVLDGGPESAFRTISPLQVTRTGPADGAHEVWTDAPILIEFNRPVASIDCVGRVADGDDSCLVLPLTLSPEIRGNGTWVDASTYRFEPSPGLQAGQPYAASLASTVTSSDGAALSEPYVWSFETAVPRVLEVSPDPGAHNVLIDVGMRIRFSTPMDHFNTSGAFSLVDSGGKPISGSATWLEGGTTLVFTPTRRLDLETSYTAAIGPRARAATSAPLEEPYSWVFSTIPYPQLLAHTPAAGALGVDVDEPVRLTFSGKVDPEALAMGIHISPEPPAGTLYTWHDDVANVFTLAWPRDPRTEACITVAPDLTDVYGNYLRSAESFCFETGDLPPMLELALPFDTITLNADRPASLQLLNRNVTSARFSLVRIGLSQLATSDSASGEVVREWTASFQPEINVTQVVTVSLNRLGGTLPTGLYALAWQPVGQNQLRHTARLAVVDRHILIKLAGEGALVWVTEIDSGAPVTRTAVQLLDQESLLLAGGTTDNDGLVTLPIPARSELWEPVVAVTGEPGAAGFGVALTTWQGDVPLWDFGVEFHTSAPPAYRAYVQVDRSIYRTGETVRYAGVLRRDLAGGYELPLPGTTVVLGLLNPSREPVYTTTAEVSSRGIFSGSMLLPDDAPSGDYSIRIASDGTADAEHVALPLTSVSFGVAAYREPAFQVLVTPETSAAILGETVRFTIEAEYYSGGSVDRGAVEWTLSAVPYNPNTEGQFSVWAMAGWRWSASFGTGERVIIDRGSGLTGPDGRYALELPADAVSQTVAPDGSQIWLLEAVVTDDAGLPVVGSARIVLHHANYYVALRPQSWIVATGERGVLHLAVVDWLGAGVPDVDVHVTLLQRTWSGASIDTTQPYTDTIITEQTVPTDADGLGVVSFRLPESGTYVVVATTTDPAGHTATAESMVWTGAGGVSIPPQISSTKLDLVVDADVYDVGDTAKILVPVTMDIPYHLLVTVEREGILWTRAYVFDHPNPVIEVPIADAYAPVAYVFCAAIVPGTETSTAQVRVGYATLTIEMAGTRLDVDVQADQATYEPGERAQLAISVVDVEGNPQEAEITVALVDASALGSETQQTLAEVFYGRRPLRVVTGDGLLMAMDRVVAAGSIPDRVEGNAPGGPHGMGDNGAGAGASGLRPRERIPDAAYFRAAISTDAQGRVELPVDLPDTLTTWEVQVWAVTPDTKVGETTETLSVGKPLSIRPITPQFLIAGDRTELAALVHNDTDQPLVVDAHLLTGEALRLESAATQQLVVAPGGRQRVAWTAIAGSTGGESAEVIFSVRSGQYTDTSSLLSPTPGNDLLPIRGPESRDVTGIAGVLNSAETRVETVMLPEGAQIGAGIVLRVDPSLTSVVLAGLNRVPHLTMVQSTDAWVSELLPIAAAHTVLAGTGRLSDELATANASAVGILDRLYLRQNPDGGWGWRHGASDLHLTSYVVHGLVQADRAGLAIRAPALSGGLSYIHDWVAHGVEAGLRHSYFAFALSVLAEAQQAWPQGAGAALYADRDRMGLAGRAYLALAFGALDKSDTRLASLLEELRSSATVSVSGVHWEDLDPQSWTTNVQSTALVLKVLTHYAPDDPLLPQIVRWLVASRETRRTTPYETAWVLSALADYAGIGGDSEAAYGWRIALNGATVIETPATDPIGRTLVLRTTGPGTERLQDGLNVLEFSRDTGPGRLYYTVRSNASLPVSPEAQGERRGMALARQYCAVGGNVATTASSEPGQCQPVDLLEVGELVEVRLTVVVPEQRHYLRIEDPFPAGFESAPQIAGDTDLAGDGSAQPSAGTGAQGDNVGVLGSPDLLDDRALFFAEQLAPGTYRASYYLRAVTPGRFHALAAAAEEIYFPEIWATTAVSVLEVVPR